MTAFCSRRLSVLVVGVAVACLLGQTAAISPAGADDGSTPALAPAAEARSRVAPANDDFGSAIVIGSAPYTNTQDVTGATTAGDDPLLSTCGTSSPKNRTVWYRYTAPSNQTVTIDTFGSSYDTLLAVWTGSRGSLTNVACSDDHTGLQSRVEFAASAGATYHIEVADYHNPSPTSSLTLNLAAGGALPGAFGKTAPANAATGVSLNPTLEWGAASGATDYEVCMDTSNDNACGDAWVSMGLATFATPNTLLPNTTYHWQARASNGGGTTYADGGTWWTFTTGSAPEAFGKTVPTNGAMVNSWVLTLFWGVANGATSYEYCLDTVNNGVCDTGWVGTGGFTGVDLSGTVPDDTYWWQVRAVNGGGTTYADGGAWWTFTAAAAPGDFGKLTPVNGATGQSLATVLDWGDSAGADHYEYCIDTVNDNLCLAGWVNAGTASMVSPPGLAPNTTYYWQARAVNTFITYADGDPAIHWSFTTGGSTMLQMVFRSEGPYDGWVLERDEDSTKGSDTLDSTSSTARLGDDDEDRQYRSILHFNTGALPDNAVVTGITLRIKKHGFTGTNPFTLDNPNQKKGLNLLKVDIQAGYYANSPDLERFDFHAVGSRGNVGRFIKTPDAGWYRAPLRAASYGLLSLTDTTQFRLRFDLDDNDDMAPDYLSFYTSNAGWLDQPELIVDYYIP